MRLVGYSVAHGCCWTKAAEAYPRNLARFLAASIAEDLKPLKRQRTVDPGVLARCGRGRVGEAANPGLRRPITRPEVDLEEVLLVRPATLALQAKVHRMFLDWLQGELSGSTWGTICRSPHLQVIFLRNLWELAVQQWAGNVSVSSFGGFLSTTVSVGAIADTTCLGPLTSMGGDTACYPQATVAEVGARRTGVPRPDLGLVQMGSCDGNRLSRCLPCWRTSYCKEKRSNPSGRRWTF